MKRNNMRVIGVTGGVGAGKSRVLEYLESCRGAYVIQADQVGHQVMEPGTMGYERVLALLGEDVKKEDGTLDRRKIGDIVFHNGELLEKLNDIIHPAVKKEILRSLEEQAESGRKLCVVEAALLLEDHYEKFCDEIWYIFAGEEVRIRRLMSSRGYTREKALGIMRNQAAEEFYRAHADYIIENNGDWEETRAQIDKGVGAQ